MKLPFVSRRRHERDLAFVNADRERLRGERNQFAQDRDTAKYNRRQVLRQHAELDAANRRLEGRVIELGRRLSALSEADPEYAAALEQRVARLRRVGARVLAAWAGEKRRADVLQARLDDACGLNHPAVEEGRDWQYRRHDGGRKQVAS